MGFQECKIKRMPVKCYFCEEITSLKQISLLNEVQQEENSRFFDWERQYRIQNPDVIANFQQPHLELPTYACEKCFDINSVLKS